MQLTDDEINSLITPLISAPSNPMNEWCPQCEATRRGGARLCNICGTTLQHREPQVASNTTNVSLHELLLGQREAVQSLISRQLTIMHQLRDDMRTERVASGVGQRELLRVAARAIAGTHDEWLQLEGRLMLQHTRARERNEAKDALLRTVERINVANNPDVLHQAKIQVGESVFQAQVFYAGIQKTPIRIEKPLIVLESPCRKSLTAEVKDKVSKQSALVLFHQKDSGGKRCCPVTASERVKEMGASGVIVACESLEHSAKKVSERVKVPVVLMKMLCAKRLLACFESKAGLPLLCVLSIEIVPNECSICFEPMDTVMHLPACGHLIHEKCALRWLEGQHSCPYCRRDLLDVSEPTAKRQRTEDEASAQTAA